MDEETSDPSTTLPCHGFLDCHGGGTRQGEGDSFDPLGVSTRPFPTVTTQAHTYRHTIPTVRVSSSRT